MSLPLKSMAHSLLVWLALGGAVYLALCAALFVFQRSLIYVPQPRSAGSSANLLTLPSAAGEVLVSTRPHAGPSAAIYFGGNAEDVSQSLPGLAAAFHDHSIYLLHYRGYGGSAGAPSEAALVADGLALFDKVHADHSRIVVIGRSLGSGIAVQVASRRGAARLVLVTPYDSLAEIAASQFAWFPMRWLLRDTYESWRDAPQVSAPTTLIAAEHDEVIPRASTELLHTRFAKGIASLEVLPGTGHNTVEQSPRYWAALIGSPNF
ncbi:MAG: dienelactone hydrolase family protein [Burkholderiaceae bacterium]